MAKSLDNPALNVHTAGPVRHCKRSTAGLLRDSRGIAALELAIVAPFLLVAAAGTYMAVQAFRVQSLLNTAAISMVDLVAAQVTVTAGSAGTLTDLCSSGTSKSLLPYNTKLVGMTIARISRQPADPAGAADWQRDDACPVKGAVAINAAELARANAALNADADKYPVVIVVKGTYDFHPSIAFTLRGYSLAMPSFYMTSTAIRKTLNPGSKLIPGNAACTNC